MLITDPETIRKSKKNQAEKILKKLDLKSSQRKDVQGNKKIRNIV